MLGAIIGDFIGSSWEGAEPFRFQGELANPASSFTDDTVLTITTAYAWATGQEPAAKYRETILDYSSLGFSEALLNWAEGVRSSSISIPATEPPSGSARWCCLPIVSTMPLNWHGPQPRPPTTIRWPYCRPSWQDQQASSLTLITARRRYAGSPPTAMPRFTGFRVWSSPGNGNRSLLPSILPAAPAVLSPVCGRAFPPGVMWILSVPWPEPFRKVCGAARPSYRPGFWTPWNASTRTCSGC